MHVDLAFGSRLASAGWLLSRNGVCHGRDLDVHTRRASVPAVNAADG